MSYDPKTGGPCAVADIRRGALDDIAEVLRGYVERKKREEGAISVKHSSPETAELLPCPFCGERPAHYAGGAVICENVSCCVIVGVTANGYGPDHDPVGVWNTRSAPAYTSPETAELMEEGIEILTNLKSSVTKHGNYSAESTAMFIDQALQCFRRATRFAQTPAVGPGVIERMVTDAWDDARSQAIEECAKIADGFTCGMCGMDGKAGSAIRALAFPSTERK
jgi:hypothetical protein